MFVQLNVCLTSTDLKVRTFPNGNLTPTASEVIFALSNQRGQPVHCAAMEVAASMSCADQYQ